MDKVSAELGVTMVDRNCKQAGGIRRMDGQWEWKLFEATGDVEAYLLYKAHSRAQESARQGKEDVKQEGSEGRDAPADDHGPGAAGHENGRG